MKNIIFQNIVHVDRDRNSHEFFYDALQQVTGTSNYWTFTNAKDALKTLISKKINPDIIFLDLDLPNMSGQKFLARMKQFEHLNNVPVIIFSGSTNRSMVQVTRILGAKGFVKKPCSKGEFTNILSSILSLEFIMHPELMFSSFSNFNQLHNSVSEELFWNESTEYGFNLN